jgi:tetratricopeptide (TPR) repeat protein
LADLNAALKRDRFFPQALLNLGVIRASRGQYLQARNTFDTLVKVTHGEALASNNLGYAQMMLGEYDEALQNFDEAINRRPDFAIAYHNRGRTLHALKKYDKALADYLQSLNIDPAKADAYYNRGRLYLETGKKKLACEDLHMADSLGWPEAKQLYQKACR